MAQVTKKSVVADYLQKNPEMAPAEIAAKIKAEKKIDVNNDYVSKVKGELKKGGNGVLKAKPKPKPKAKAGSKAKPKAKANGPKPAPSAAAASAAKASKLTSAHIANIKAAVEHLGKDEARRILDLF